MAVGSLPLEEVESRQVLMFLQQDQIMFPEGVFRPQLNGNIFIYLQFHHQITLVFPLGYTFSCKDESQCVSV